MGGSGFHRRRAGFCKDQAAGQSDAVLPAADTGDALLDVPPHGLRCGKAVAAADGVLNLGMLFQHAVRNIISRNPAQLATKASPSAICCRSVARRCSDRQVERKVVVEDAAAGGMWVNAAGRFRGLDGDGVLHTRRIFCVCQFHHVTKSHAALHVVYGPDRQGPESTISGSTVILG